MFFKTEYVDFASYAGRSTQILYCRDCPVEAHRYCTVEIVRKPQRNLSQEFILLKLSTLTFISTNLPKKLAKNPTNVPARFCNYTNLIKKRSIIKAFILNQLPYCPLVRMFYTSTVNKVIDTIHKKALRLVYSNYLTQIRAHHKLCPSVTQKL